MKVIDYAPFVIEALKESNREMTGSDLSEAVWGTSGRGNTKLTNSLFPHMVRTGTIVMRQKGRAKYYSLPKS